MSLSELTDWHSRIVWSFVTLAATGFLAWALPWYVGGAVMGGAIWVLR